MGDALELTARQLLSFYPVRVRTVELVGQSANTVFMPDHGEWLPGHLAKLAAREFARYAAGEPFLYGGTPYWE
jgi:hypothetical protein